MKKWRRDDKVRENTEGSKVCGLISHNEDFFFFYGKDGELVNILRDLTYIQRNSMAAL